MRIILTEQQFNEMFEPKLLSRKKYTQDEMVKLGANYHLAHGMLMMIPVNSIDGLDPEPSDWSDDEGNYRDFEKGQTIEKPIEVIYDQDSNGFLLQDGNHRVKQAKINGDSYIKAFVQADNRQYLKWLNS